jgi:hypothetical protein
MESKRKQRRRPPQKALRSLTLEELLQEPEFRRWRFHAPGNLKRKTYEAVRKALTNARALVSAGQDKKWVDRV